MPPSTFTATSRLLLSAGWLALTAVACQSSATTPPAASSTADAPDSAEVERSTRDVPGDAAGPGATDAAGATSEPDAAGADAAAPDDVVTPAPPAATAPPDMAFVPGGTFTMGDDAGREGDERPAHDVTLRSFFLDRTEVTQEAYEACVRAGACKAADAGILATFGGLFRGPRKPVVGVTWFDAKAYCTWRGKRLPREAEYERAVRGTDGRRFPWGNEAPTHERTVFSTNAPEDVGSHPAGCGPFGHDDLAGNVWEWIDDDYDPYAYRRSTAAEGRPGTCDQILAAQNELRRQGKQGFTGTNPIPTECEKSIRGGAYNYPAEGLRSTNRIHHPPRFKLRMTGIRCAMDAR